VANKSTRFCALPAAHAYAAAHATTITIMNDDEEGALAARPPATALELADGLDAAMARAGMCSDVIGVVLNVGDVEGDKDDGAGKERRALIVADHLENVTRLIVFGAPSQHTPSIGDIFVATDVQPGVWDDEPCLRTSFDTVLEWTLTDAEVPAIALVGAWCEHHGGAAAIWAKLTGEPAAAAAAATTTTTTTVHTNTRQQRQHRHHDDNNNTHTCTHTRPRTTIHTGANK